MHSLLSLASLLANSCFFVYLAAAISPSSHAFSSTPSTTFHVTSGSNENYFYRDNTTSGQLLITSPVTASANTTRRIVVALPAGNNGALIYLLPKILSGTGSNSPLNIQLVNGSLKSTVSENGNQGLQADLALTGNATLGVTIVGAVRALRDYVEGSGTMHEIFNYTLLSFSSTEVRLHRQYINSTSSAAPSSSSNAKHKPEHEQPTFKSVDLYISIPPGSSGHLSVKPSSNGTFTPPTIDILLPHASRAPVYMLDVLGSSPPPENHIRIRVVTNDTSLIGLDDDDLFLTPAQASNNILATTLENLASNVTEQVSFLTFRDKFTAGGWRFLTYFGRDSLIALRMLMPLLTAEAIESALGAVIERANSTGALCHEETIGDYASFINLGNGRPDLGNTPFYDYKMIDTDLLLLPAMAHYFLELHGGLRRSSQFLAKEATLQHGTYLDIVNRIASYNINRAIPFVVANPPTVSDLLAFRPGQPVGNWRDSNEGTGYGTIPFDVNVALVPSNLRAIESLTNAAILNISMLNFNHSFTVADMATKWEAEAPGMFEVSMNSDTAKQRLQSFVQAASLDQSLLGNATSAGGNITFYALSLMPDGTPVEVLNSDLGFNLMYGTNVSSAFLERVAESLTPYPRGLLTNIGMVVANPAYDSNRTNIEVLDRTAYHGTVIWSFQQALMAGGLARQLGFCINTTTIDTNVSPSPSPTWCSDVDLIQRLQAAQTRLWNSIKGASQNIYSEVWSYSFDNITKTFSVADLATLSPTGTESDAIQLWSYAFLGLIDPDMHCFGLLHESLKSV